jgi:diacylglycerol kinase (ATP)
MGSKQASPVTRRQPVAPTVNVDAIVDAVGEYSLVYIFVNPTSGGNKAAALMSQETNPLTFSEDGLRAQIFIHNIRDGEHGNKPGFHDMRDRVNAYSGTEPVHVIVAGGDGTVMWAIQEAQAHNVALGKVAFGHIPYGTGNDFARSLGWGGSNPSKSIMQNGMKVFKNMIKEYIGADVIDFDIWNVELKVEDAGGMIKQVKDGEKVPMMEGSTERKVLIKPMCNYFSLGIESRIGLGFDKKRTTSAFRNKVRYVLEGFKKSMMSFTRINEMVEECVVEENGITRTIFSNTSMSAKVPKLSGDPISLIFLNINSFGAGCDLWRVANKTGITPTELSPAFTKQSVGDHKLDIMTYNRLASLTMEQSKNTVMGGNGRCVAQEKGPIVLRFRKETADKRTYLQIDGEFFALERCEKVTLSHNMVIKVLKKRAPSK